MFADSGENQDEQENVTGKFYPYNGMLSSNRAMTLWSKLRSDDCLKQRNPRIEQGALGRREPEPGVHSEGPAQGQTTLKPC